MGKVAANPNSRLLLDQYDISGFLNSFNFNLKQEVIVTTGLSDAGPRRLVGGYDISDGHTAMFDGAAAQIDEILQGLVGNDSDHYYSRLFGANAENSISHDTIVKLSGRPHKGQSGGLVLMDTKVEGANGTSRGLVLCNATITAIGARTGRNQGATTAGQTYQSIVRVLSGTFTSITVRIQQSNDDGAVDPYADIAGMTTTFAVANTAAVARLTTTAVTKAWKRVNIQAFTGTSALIVVTGGLVAGT